MFLFWISIIITIIIIVIAYRQEQHQQPWLLFLLGQAQKEVDGGVEEMQRTAIESAANACRLVCMFCQF